MKPSLWSVWFAGWPCASLCTRHSTHPHVSPLRSHFWLPGMATSSHLQKDSLLQNSQGSGPVSASPAAGDRGHGGQGSGPVSMSPAAGDRGHGAQGSGPASTSPAAGDRQPEHPSRRGAARVRCCCSGHHALRPGHPSRPLGHPHFSAAALMNSCLQLSGLQIPEKVCGSLSPSSTSGMCWLGLTLR